MKAAKYEKNPVTLRTLREKCNEYTSRAETLKDGLLSGGGSAAAKKSAQGKEKEEEDWEEGDLA